MPPANGHAPWEMATIDANCRSTNASINVYPKIHQDILQNSPSWAPKSIKLGSKIHQVGFQNQEKSVLGGLWRGLGAILAPRAAQDQNIPPKPISGGPLGDPFWRPKSFQNQFFRVPRGVNFLINFLIGPRSIFLGF